MHTDIPPISAYDVHHRDMDPYLVQDLSIHPPDADGADEAALKKAPTINLDGPFLSDADADTWDWDTDPANPYNWSAGRKWAQVAVAAVSAIVTSIGTSIISPAHADLMAAFDINSTQAILPLSLYVFALGIGPIVIGGPLSETIGRLPILLVGMPVGTLFTIGAALVPTSSLAGLCILRFLTGFAWSPSLAISAGMLSETFRPATRGPPVAVFVLMPFLGPGMGPVIGAFALRKGWRWSQWTLVFFGAFASCVTACGRETYHPILRRRRAAALGRLDKEILDHPTVAPAARLRAFVTVGLLRPLHMLVAEPIVALCSLYVACEFSTLFSFFAAVPYVFQVVYGFGREDCGLVFIGIVVGCLLGLLTVLACDVLLYRGRAVPRYPPHAVPPEHRLYAAMIGSLGLPVGIFWFGWSAAHHAHWAAPVVAIVPFAWGNMCIFISLMQYIGDVYDGDVVASAGSANSLARYTLAGVLPLLTLQMYEHLGIGWASSLLGFVAVALLPLPWLFFRLGPLVRAHSRYAKTA